MLTTQEKDAIWESKLYQPRMSWIAKGVRGQRLEVFLGLDYQLFYIAGPGRPSLDGDPQVSQHTLASTGEDAVAFATLYIPKGPARNRLLELLAIKHPEARLYRAIHSEECGVYRQEFRDAEYFGQYDPSKHHNLVVPGQDVSRLSRSLSEAAKAAMSFPLESELDSDEDLDSLYSELRDARYDTESNLE